MKKYTEQEIQGAEARVRELMRGFRLSGMAERWEQMHQQQSWIEQPQVIQLEDLLNHEFERRSSNAIRRLIKQSNLPTQLLEADFAEFRLEANRKIDMHKYTLLSTGDWMWRERPADLVIAGTTGVGKSYLAACCCKRAMAHKYRSYFVRASRLFTELRICEQQGSLEQKKAELARIPVLVLDDFLLEDMSEMDLSDLLHIIEDRAGKHPTIFTSQYPLETWIKRMKLNALAETIVDRLAHSAYHLTLQGPSQREKVK